MPTYEYACQACSHEFEEYQPITAKPLRTCPKCRKPKLKRLIGAGGGVIFKGSGFYQTDYRSESYKKAAEAETQSSSGSSSGDKAAKGDGGGAKSDGAAKSDGTTKSPSPDSGSKDSKPSKAGDKSKKKAG